VHQRIEDLDACLGVGIVCENVDEAHDEESGGEHRPEAEGDPLRAQWVNVGHEHFLHDGRFYLSEVAQVHDDD